jgi:hypothetical protein
VSAKVAAGGPFTAANVTGLVAALALGVSMALYARVRVSRSSSAITG